MDGAHLKGQFKGTLFVAVGMDGNNQIVPIAYGFGKAEDGPSWKWFLQRLRECIGSPRDLAFISDRAKSINIAVSSIFPEAYHGICCRHLLMNLRKLRLTSKYDPLWWQTCKAYRKSDFEEGFEALCAAVPKVRKYLVDVGFDKWSRAHCGGKRYNVMTSNSAESMNALCTNARKMPVTKLYEFFRQSVQDWFFTRRIKGGKNLLHSLIYCKITWM